MSISFQVFREAIEGPSGNGGYASSHLRGIDLRAHYTVVRVESIFTSSIFSHASIKSIFQVDTQIVYF